MTARRINPNLVKSNRSYTAIELATRLGVHKNSVRNWQRAGLVALVGGRPILFHGGTVRAFLTQRNAARKRPCPPGTLYCFYCREPRPPALGMIEFVTSAGPTGNLRAICGICETIMHRRASRDALAVVMPGIDVQFREASARLIGRTGPSPNCDVEREDAT